MRIIVCDDEKSILEEFKGLLEAEENVDEAAFCADAESMIRLCENEKYDMAFIDIQLKNDNGIKVAEKIKSALPEIKIIFITAYVFKYVNDIFDGIQPYGFIKKPLDHGKIRFYMARLKAAQERSERKIVLMHNRNNVEFPLSSIMHIESDKRIARIHCVDGGVIEIYEKLSNIEKRLDERFIRCHQSYIINVEHIGYIEGEWAIMKDGSKVSISRSRAEAAKHSYLVYKGREII